MLTGEQAIEPVKPIGIRAYARRRGTSAQSVLRAIARGRLKDSLVYVDGTAQVADPDLADREWSNNTDLTKAPAYVKERADRVPPTGTPGTPRDDAGDEPPTLFPGMSLADASKADKYWAAKLKELEYRQAAGELVERQGLSDYLTDLFTFCKTKLLGVPGKVKSRHPAMPLAHVAAVDAEIREALEELADAKGWEIRTMKS